MRSIIILLLLTIAGLQYKLWLGDGNLMQWRALQQQIAQQQEENKQLVARNHAIEADIIELKIGEQALEEQARYELGMVKQGEIYYQFVE